MLDALLFAVRDALRGGGFGLDTRSCDVTADGRPPPRCGDEYVAVHPGGSSSTMDNALDEYFSFSVTLTRRVTVPWDRIGDQLLARKLAREPGPGGRPSFNARAEQLRAFLHMAWGVLGEANNYLAAWAPDDRPVYGFAEPARYRGMAAPSLVGGEHFWAEPEAREVGLTAELRFEDARRLQAIGSYS